MPQSPDPQTTTGKAAPRPAKPKARPNSAKRKTAPKAKKAAPRPGLAPMLWAATLAFVVDQLLKTWVLHGLHLDRIRSMDVASPWLQFRMAWNRGVNFGLFSSDGGPDGDITRWILVAIAVAVSAWVFWWMWRARAGAWVQIAAGLVIGGALGNAVDRVIYGAVADFLNMSLPAWQNPYSFNVADIAIFVGAVGLVLAPQPQMRR